MINPGPNGDRNNEEYENDTLDDVDQLLDDALEESYRSVLETDQSSHSSMSNPSSMVMAGHDRKNHNGDPNLVNLNYLLSLHVQIQNHELDLLKFLSCVLQIEFYVHDLLRFC